MLEAAERIERYVDGLDEARFVQQELIQDAVVRNLEVIGEASRNIMRTDPEFAAAHPELPLAPAYDMRNSLSHGYFKIDFSVVWNTVRRDLPLLRAAVKRSLNDDS